MAAALNLHAARDQRQQKASGRQSEVAWVRCGRRPAHGVTVTGGRLGDARDSRMGCNVDVFHLRRQHEVAQIVSRSTAR